MKPLRPHPVRTAAHRAAWLAVSILSALTAPSAATKPTEEPDALLREAESALQRAIRFFDDHVSTEGGYLWRYSSDLSKREGEGRVEGRTAWVQPPGTPFVGEVFLDIWALTGEERALLAAKSCARLLVRGQLRSGGWTYRVELDPRERHRYAYRVDGEPARRARDVSTLDDDTTQAAIRFLARCDRALDFADEAVHRCARSALDSLLAAQYANGGWPQGYRGPVDREAHPVVRASYSPTGEYTRRKEYWDLYTINDGLVESTVRTLLLAAEIYAEPRYRHAAIRAGEFLILAQMPDPQPAWAQQYDFAMRPAWARKFEPPAISGGESQGALTTLLDLFEATSDERFLEPVPRALAYLRRSLLPDGRLARFYEPRTNRPLYFDRRYELTYDDGDVPTHYAFRVPSRLDAIERRYGELRAGEPHRSRTTTSPAAPPSPAEARAIIDALDDRGAWVDEGRLRYHGEADTTRRIVDPRTFASKARALARFIAARRRAAAHGQAHPTKR